MSGAYIDSMRESGNLPSDVKDAMVLSEKTRYFLYNASVPTEKDFMKEFHKGQVEEEFLDCESCIDQGFIWKYLPPVWTDFRDHSKQLKYLGWCQPDWEGCGESDYWKVTSLASQYNNDPVLSTHTLWRGTSCYDGSEGIPIEVLKCPVEVEPSFADRH